MKEPITELTLEDKYYFLGKELGSHFLDYVGRYVLPKEVVHFLDDCGGKFDNTQKPILLKLNEFVKNRGFETIEFFLKRGFKENLTICYFFRLLQSYCSVLTLLRSGCFLDAMILRRCGIELMSKLYAIIHSPCFVEYLFLSQSLRSSKELPRIYPSIRTVQKSQQKNEEFNSLKYKIKDDNFHKQYKINPPKKILCRKYEKNILKIFEEKIFSTLEHKKGNNFNPMELAKKQSSDLIHSNEDVAKYFATWKSYNLIFDSPDGFNSDVDIEMEVLGLRELWLVSLDIIFHEFFDCFKLNKKELLILSQDLKYLRKEK